LLPLPSFSGFANEVGDRLGYVLPMRKLGKTGADVTMLGVGGYHIGWTTERDVQEVIETALEGGIRFFDTAESYGPHTSEIRYGKYLTPKYRDLIFLMTKSYSKDADTARKHLDESLKRMKTDYLDLWQVHSVGNPAGVDERIEKGVFEVMQEAKASGKVKHIGFTGHRNPAAHLRVLDKTKSSQIFETVQMPINVLDAGLDHFIRKVMPVALERHMGVIAMKTMSDGRFFPNKVENGKTTWTTEDPVISNRLSVKEALYFVWSLPVSVLVTGAENAAFVQEKIDLAKNFHAMTPAERDILINKVDDLARESKTEYYKKF
jgi:predicted aldo/keto reductase-like oxidoreductase